MKDPRRPSRSRLSYDRLEPRRLLNADFALSLGVLTIDNYVDTNTIANDENLEIRFDSGTNSFIFELSDGNWFDGGSDTGSNILSVLATDLTDSLIINDSAAINFGVNFDTGVDAIDLSGLANQVTIGIGTGSLTDSGGAALTFGTLDVTASGAMTFGDDTDFNSTQVTFNSNGAVNIAEDSDVVVVGNNTANSLTLNSGGAISQNVGSSITVTTTSSFTAVGDICLTEAH